MFNNQCAKYAGSISDPTLAIKLSDGRAYEFSTQQFLSSIHNPALHAGVTHVFAKAMSTIWYAGHAFAALGLVITLFEKEIELRQDLKTEFRMVEKKVTEKAQVPADT